MCHAARRYVATTGACTRQKPQTNRLLSRVCYQVSYGTQSKHFPPPSFLMKRPARKQVEEFTKRGVIEDMGEYNIW